MSLQLSHARLSQLSWKDIHDLYKLRVDVFVHEQQCPYQEIDDIDPLTDTLHIIGRDDRGMIMGCARLFPDTREHFVQKCLGDVVLDDASDLVQIGRLVTATSARGQGEGRRLLEYACALADAEYPGVLQVITAQVPLEQYYESFGFVRCGDVFDWDGMDHLPMMRRGR
ncbi:GNAT family N-acetyltransferase [Corynebacterium choanae]|uniref:Putative acyltransferase n=1 Tax=Corynebacterium choanae TaxID=1862358 RepID=A0A3G6J3Z9_9CORY|nr:GNAT family N-acetyltransferase [Corynebacterium choanae]AZA12666.1 putative acyltransferase [Corynebacterium choanae]